MAGAFSIHFWEPVMALFFRCGGAGGQCGGSGREERHERVPGDDEAAPGDIEKLYGVITKCYGTAQRDVVRLGEHPGGFFGISEVAESSDGG